MTLPLGYRYLHDMFNEAPASERSQLAWRWLRKGYPRLAGRILLGTVTAASLPAVVDPDGLILRLPMEFNQQLGELEGV